MNDRIKEECRDLWRNCFHDSESYMDFYFQEKCKDNYIIVDVEDNHVVSMVHLNPYHLRWQGKEVNSCYIVGVSTEEAYRRQGKMRELLEQAFLKMQSEQVPFTYLMPANKKIYEPFGFEAIYRQERILLKGIETRKVFKKQEVKLQAADVAKTEKECSESVLEMKYFLELTPKELEAMVSYASKKLEAEFDIYAIRDKAYYIRLRKEMKACLGDIVVFVEKRLEQGRVLESRIAGVMSYGLENGYMEVTEALIETELTQDIVNLLLQRIEAQDKSQIYFYESYFLDKEQLSAMAEQMETFGKETIMAKVLEPQSSFGEMFGEQRVYLNEIV